MSGVGRRVEGGGGGGLKIKGTLHPVRTGFGEGHSTEAPPHSKREGGRELFLSCSCGALAPERRVCVRERERWRGRERGRGRERARGGEGDEETLGRRTCPRRSLFLSQRDEEREKEREKEREREREPAREPANERERDLPSPLAILSAPPSQGCSQRDVGERGGRGGE